MERGVVVGGLMICGSFLLAAVLNRSAMEEVPVPATPVAIEAVVPVSPAVVAPASAPTLTDCAEARTRADAQSSKTDTDASGSDLMVNGLEPCPR